MGVFYKKMAATPLAESETKRGFKHKVTLCLNDRNTTVFFSTAYLSSLQDNEKMDKFALYLNF